jgi:hypothetical protein
MKEWQDKSFNLTCIFQKFKLTCIFQKFIKLKKSMANPPPNDNDEYWRLLGKALFDGTWSDNSYAEIFDKPGGGDNSDSENDKLM